ncbi:hypothetical protein [Cryobacterium sp. Y62]|uniref:hypothetical protein n=1 Tax=Cryobacterium sp. Y62 TaxID=2048284 RepID=UPI0018EA7F60|nr:hypothetical protein [Cryobacterium sp. Y62]
MVEHFGQQLTALVEGLRTVADPDAAEAQIESVTTETAERVAASTARARLTWEERGGAGEPITVATEPISVLAWVRYPKISTHVDDQALAWTRRAVYVEW